MKNDSERRGKSDYSHLDRQLDQGWSVFEYYYPMHVNGKKDTNLRLGNKVIAPFLRDGKLETDPSFSVFMHRSKGTVFFKDHGLDRIGTHWQFVMDLYGLDFREAVKKVKQDILGISSSGHQPIVARPLNFKRPEPPKNAEVQLTPGYRDWNDSDLAWYKSAGITLPTLNAFKVHAASYYDCRKEDKTFRITAKENSPMYSIDFVSGRRKIYQPFADPRFKWTSNTKADDDVFGWHILPTKVKHLFLIGGNRDTMSFFENIKLPCAALASESANIAPGILSTLRHIAEYVWVLYDNDKQGLKKAEQFKEEYKFGTLNHIYQEFKGSNPDGTANDFVNMYQSNENPIPRFLFFLEKNTKNLYI